MLHSVTQIIANGRLSRILPALVFLLLAGHSHAQSDTPENAPDEQSRATFMRAWATARRGDIEGMKREGSTIENYLLHPYLEYNELLATRRTVDPERMSGFLD